MIRPSPALLSETPEGSISSIRVPLLSLPLAIPPRQDLDGCLSCDAPACRAAGEGGRLKLFGEILGKQTLQARGRI